MQEPATPPTSATRPGATPAGAPTEGPTGPSHAALAALRRQRRWRTWGVLIAVSVGWKLVVLTLGAAMPRWLIDDGVASLPSDLQPYARDAKRNAAQLWNGPIERHGVVRTLRVMSVHRVATGTGGRCGGLGARVRAYTYFGLPYSDARLVCDSGVVEYRVFRRGSSRAAPATVPNGARGTAEAAPLVGPRGSN